MKTTQIEEKCMSTSSLDYDEWTQIKVFMKEWYDMEIHEKEKKMATSKLYQSRHTDNKSH